MSERDLTITEYRKISITHSRNTFAGYADRFLRRVFSMEMLIIKYLSVALYYQ